MSSRQLPALKCGAKLLLFFELQLFYRIFLSSLSKIT